MNLIPADVQDVAAGRLVRAVMWLCGECCDKCKTRAESLSRHGGEARLLLAAIDAPAETVPDAHVWPEHWPPIGGDMWRDRQDNHWVSFKRGTLVCMETTDPDGGLSVPADEVEKGHGPLVCVSRLVHGQVKLMETFPAHWPPRHGDVWVDAKGDKWLCESNRGIEWMAGPYLVCITRQGDDNAEEIRRTCGPLSLYSRAVDEDVPF